MLSLAAGADLDPARGRVVNRVHRIGDEIDQHLFEPHLLGADPQPRRHRP